MHTYLRLLLVILTGLALSTHAQSGRYITALDTVFTEAEYDIILESAISELVINDNLNRNIFNVVYPAYKDTLHKLTKPVVVRYLTKIYDKKSGKKGLQPPKLSKQELKDSLFKYIKEGLFENARIIKQMQTIDETDRILRYDSDIKVLKNGALHITENILFFNGNSNNTDVYESINTMISRHFRTDYLTPKKFLEYRPYTIKEVKLNNTSVEYNESPYGDGIDISIFSLDTPFEKGYLQYTIKYETTKHLRFGKGKTELEWDVTGHHWSMNADSVICRITFPNGTKLLNYSSNIESANESVESNGTTKIINDSTIQFLSSSTIARYKGFSISAAVANGTIHPPTSSEIRSAIIQDNAIFKFLLASIILLGLINFYIWRKHGRDKQEGIILPQYEPPVGMSPADVGYIYKQQYNETIFSSSLIDHVVNGMLEIEVLTGENQGYYFREPQNPVNETEFKKRREWYGYDVRKLYGVLSAPGQPNTSLQSCYILLEVQLKQRLLKRGDYNNSVVGMFNLNTDKATRGFVFLGILAVISLIYLWGKDASSTNRVVMLILTIGIGMQFFFKKIMGAYTVEGKKTLNHILGLRMYLEAAEQRIFDNSNPPEKTIQLFEKLLPYATALECQNRWATIFGATIKTALSSDIGANVAGASLINNLNRSLYDNSKGEINFTLGDDLQNQIAKAIMKQVKNKL